MLEAEVIQTLYPQPGEKAEPGPVRGRRFTQDTPIMPEVWIAYGTAGDRAGSQRLLLTPNAAGSVSELVTHLRNALAWIRGTEGRRVFLAYNESHVMARLTFREAVLAALPLSSWWDRRLKNIPLADRLREIRDLPDLGRIMTEPGRRVEANLPADALDMVRIAGAIALNRPLEFTVEYWRALIDAAIGLFTALPPPHDATEPPLWSVFLCRQAESAVTQSRLSVKADAATRLFDLSCKDLAWAVIDSGIDSEHPAFTEWPRKDGKPPRSRSRIEASYDFTRITAVQEAAFSGDIDVLRDLAPGVPDEELREAAEDLGQRLVSGRLLDWTLMERLLRVRQDKCGKAPPPVNEHGTHVAGILAADWRRLNGATAPREDYREPEQDFAGLCPDLRLYDLRVIGPDGSGDEFAVLSALQFVRRLNASKDKMVVHGVNLSFSLPQKVMSFACGSSPVCVECDRLVNSGVVVVAAAGNRGYAAGQDGFECFRNISITDPGNAESVITVGATHRSEPHRYGVSFFSSRGPTGDGRLKPDLVAPGEKILSIAPSSMSFLALDGTSMAAPHASGAAALLMARHRELIGKPRRVKEILCSTATDLGRERSFQGAGMLDVLRALQSV